MLDHSVVGEELRTLASVFRRKVSSDMVFAYGRTLEGKLSEDQFRAACAGILEHENSFPAPSLILAYGRARARHHAEVGEPYVEKSRLRDVLNQIQGGGTLPPFEAQFANDVERLEYEDAVITSGRKPPEDKDLIEWVRGVAAKAEGNLAKIREIERERGLRDASA